MARSLTERQIRRRERIMSAARRLIGSEGFEGVTMRELAQEAGVAPRTLYQLFGSKEELLRKAVEERYRHLYQTIDEAEIDKGIHRLFHIIDTVTEATHSNTAYARALLPLFRADSGDTFNLIRMHTYRRAIDQIADEGDFQDWVDVDVLSTLIFRQLNPIFLSSWLERTPAQTASSVVKLDICLVLAAVTEGYTHEQVVAMAREIQAQLEGLDA